MDFEILRIRSGRSHSTGCYAFGRVMSDQAPLLGQAQASDHVQAPEHTQAPEHAQAREQATAPEQARLDSGHGHGEGAATAPLMSARGLGGSLLLYPNHIEIQHFGVLYLLVEFFSFHVPRMNVKILRNQIT